MSDAYGRSRPGQILGALDAPLPAPRRRAAVVAMPSATDASSAQTAPAYRVPYITDSGRALLVGFDCGSRPTIADAFAHVRDLFTDAVDPGARRSSGRW